MAAKYFFAPLYILKNIQYIDSNVAIFTFILRNVSKLQALKAHRGGLEFGAFQFAKKMTILESNFHPEGKRKPENVGKKETSHMFFCMCFLTFYLFSLTAISPTFR